MRQTPYFILKLIEIFCILRQDMRLNKTVYTAHNNFWLLGAVKAQRGIVSMLYILTSQTTWTALSGELIVVVFLDKIIAYVYF